MLRPNANYSARPPALASRARPSYQQIAEENDVLRERNAQLIEGSQLLQSFATNVSELLGFVYNRSPKSLPDLFAQIHDMFVAMQDEMEASRALPNLVAAPVSDSQVQTEDVQDQTLQSAQVPSQFAEVFSLAGTKQQMNATGPSASAKVHTLSISSGDLAFSGLSDFMKVSQPEAVLEPTKQTAIYNIPASQALRFSALNHSLLVARQDAIRSIRVIQSFYDDVLLTNGQLVSLFRHYVSTGKRIVDIAEKRYAVPRAALVLRMLPDCELQLNGATGVRVDHAGLCQLADGLSELFSGFVARYGTVQLSYSVSEPQSASTADCVTIR